MPFIPHTTQDIDQMLAAIGVNSIDDLFSEIPADLRKSFLHDIPEGYSELEITRLMQARAKQDEINLSFIGAGAYEHHIPAAIFDLLSRGEFLTAYTPYQAEASQGSLQLIYEYQTMMANLTGMDVSNASLYDGASALAEAVLMAVRLNSKNFKKILIPKTVHPAYRRVVQSIVKHQGIELTEVDFDKKYGTTTIEVLNKMNTKEFAALVIPQPNFFGCLEEVDQLTHWAHGQGALVIALVNPISLALLKAPGAWGDTGADIVCGEGQALGVPLSSGGPYFGFLCCKQTYVRQMPGRIVGQTVDLDGKRGFTLTLQAREQHIRRSKATSNICTNQGLMVVAATIYMSLLGAEGMRRVSAASHHNAVELLSKLSSIKGVKKVFDRPVFHEFVLKFDQPVSSILNALAEQNIQSGYDLSHDYPELGNCLLVCVTETKTSEDLDKFQHALKRVIQNSQKVIAC